MRLMSFALTKPQILAQTKTVTRRLGWNSARVGDVVQPVEKGQGLKKGETVVRIGCPIRFVQVSREHLEDITPQDIFREGFPTLPKREFLKMFQQHNSCSRRTVVTRIAFEYTEPR